MVKVIEEKCTGCGDCMEICPCGAISVKEGKARIDLTKCAGCNACATICKSKAIKR